MLGLVLLPVAVYGWLHRLLPILLINWAINDSPSSHVNRTHVSTTAILAGVVSFGLCYGAYVAIFHALFGLPASLWYALSLAGRQPCGALLSARTAPVCLAMRFLFVRLRAPAAARRLLALREELIAEIDAARWQVPTEALTQERKGRL